MSVPAEELFDISKDRDTFFGWLLLEATTKISKQDFGEILDAATVGDRKGVFRLSLTMNGVALPVRKMIDHLERGLDEMIKERAEDIITARLQGRLDLIDEATNRAREILLAALRGEPLPE